MAGTDFSHLTNDELIKGIKALDLPDYIRSKAYGVDVRETLAQMTEMTIQLGVNMGLSPDEALKWARKLQEAVSQSEFDSWVATLLDGGPSIFMNTLSELKTTYPNGASGVALVRETDPAKIYVWNGSAWEDFGDYSGIADNAYSGSNDFPRGNFENEGGTPGLADGLVSYFSATLSHQAGVQKFKATVGNAGIGLNFKPSTNDVYFVTTLVKSTSNAVGLKVVNSDNVWQKMYHTGRGSFERLSVLTSIKDTSSNIRVTDDKASGWEDVSVRNLIVLNVSKIFGGKIPPIGFLNSIVARLGWVDAGPTILATTQDLIEASKGELNKVYANVINDSDPNIKYVGTGWRAETGLSTTNYLNGTRHITGDAGDSLEYSFFGSGVRVYAAKSAQRGMIEVFIDETSFGVFNMAASTATFDNVVFEVGNLSLKNHTVRIVVANHFDTMATTPYFDFNRFEVVTSDNVANKVINTKTNEAMNVWVGSSSDYESISSPSSDTLYLIGE